MAECKSKKVYVKVRADHEIDGRVVPLMFRSEDGEAVRVDRVTDVRQAASLKAGGQGIRYTCRVMGRLVYLFDDHGRWFLDDSADESPRFPATVGG